MEPSLGKTPVAFNCCGSDAQNVCCLFNGEAPEVTQLDHACFLFVESREGFECIVESDEFCASFDRAIYIFVQGEFLKVLAALFRIVLTRVVDEQAAHYLGGNTEKMGPVLPVNPRLIYET